MKRKLYCLALAALALAGCEQTMEPVREAAAPGAPLLAMGVGTCDQFQVPGLSASMAPSFSLGGTLVPGSYTPADLQGGFSSGVYGINNHETVAGFVTVAGSTQAAFKIAGAAAWTTIVVPGATQSIAHAINDRNQIAGVAVVDGVLRPFLYTGGQGYLLELPVGHTTGAAYGINEHGQVVGNVGTGSGSRAFLWTPEMPNATAGTTTLLATTNSVAYGLNDRGDVVGNVGSNAFRWTADVPNSGTGSLQTMGRPSGFTTAIARGINASGAVVGYGQRSSRDVAFYWNAGEGFVVIEPFAGGNSSQAWAINDAGIVSGHANAPGRNLQAFVWSSAAGERVLQDLGKLGFPNSCGSRGFAINDCSIIAGLSVRDGDNATAATQWGLCEDPLPAIEVTKTAGSSVVPAGDTLSFTIEVRSTGPGTATSVTLVDPLPDGPGVDWSIRTQPAGEPAPCRVTTDPVTGEQTLSCAFGSLAPNATRSVTIHSATAANSCGIYDNTVTVSADRIQDVQATGTTAVDCPPPPSLRIRKFAGRDEVNPWHKIKFTIEVESLGPATATNVVVTDTLPVREGIRWFIFPAAPECSISTAGGKQVLTCDYGDMPAGSEESVSVKAFSFARSCGTFDNVAYARADNHPVVSDDATTRVKCLNLPPPDLRLRKTALAESVKPGGTIGFNLTVSNAGLTAAENVVLVDTLQVRPGINWQVSGSSGCSIDGNVLTCEFGNLPFLASRTVSLRSATTTASCGTFRNRAWVEADNHVAAADSAQTAVVNCATPPPSLRVSKQALSSAVNAGSKAGFTMTVTNVGGQTATNVVLSDVLPTGNGLNWTIYPSVPGCSISAGRLTCNFGSLQPGASRSVTIKTSTTANSCGTYNNTAYATAANASKASGTASLTVRCITYCKTSYWKHNKHQWRGYGTHQYFNSVFGRTLFTSSRSLSGVLESTGTDANTLFGQQAVAALLNAAHPKVNYPLSVGQVIDRVRRAGTWGNPSINDVRRQLEQMNNAAVLQD